MRSARISSLRSRTGSGLQDGYHHGGGVVPFLPPPFCARASRAPSTLAFAGAALQLQRQFDHLASPVAAHGMPLAQQAAGRVHRDAAAEARGARLDERAAVALRAQAELFVADDLGRRAGVVQLDDVEVVGPTPASA